MTPGDRGRLLNYRRASLKKPIPAWKHVIFAPLLCFIGLFIVVAAVWVVIGVFRLILGA